MPLKTPSDSRFKISDPIVTVEGYETWGHMRKFEFLVRDRYIEYKVPQNLEHRPDLIADNYYGSPSYHWVIIMYNRPRNALQWPKGGEIIKLPRKGDVLSEL